MKRFFLFFIGLFYTQCSYAELHFSVFTSELENELASINIPFSFQTGAFQVSSTSLALSVIILNEENQIIAELSSSQFIKTDSSLFGSFTIPIKQPNQWTPDSPYLYKATVSVMNKDEVIEKNEITFGIRWMNIERNEWRMNGKRLQLKGVVYRYHPQFWQTDLLLMQQAHINAIRVEDHYPPDEFLSVCDAMGIMVVCPPPDNITAKPFVPSHPCIIAWELPAPPMLESSITILQSVDTSRFIIADGNPAVPNVAWKLDTYSNAPPNEWQLRRVKPLLLLNEPRIDGNRMEGIKEAIRLMNTEEHMAGFFIHRFAAEDETSGLVTADRAVTPNYIQAQSVFSPIQIKEDEVEIKAGENQIELEVFNHFQQINLSETTCRWVLLQDQKAIQNGSLYLNVPPQKSFEMEIECALPNDVDRHFYFLAIQFMAGGQPFHRHVVRLQPKKWEEKLVMRLDDLALDEAWTVNTKIEGSDFKHENFLFYDQSPQAGWFFITQDGHVRLITEGPFVITSEDEIKSSTSPSLIRDLWKTKSDVNRERKNIVVQSSMHSLQHERELNMELTTLFSPFGFMDMQFQLFPADEFIDMNILGLSFRLSPTLTHFQYVGKGPYPAYPGRRALNQFGIFSFTDWNGFIPGNREDVTLAAFTGKHGYGLGIMMLDGSLSVLPSDEGALVSINAVVAGLGSHNHKTQYPIDVSNISRNGYRAAFRLIPLNKNKFPELFKNTFKN